MIVDAHTHIFPPAVRARRETLLSSEPAFAEIYTDPRAAMTTAEELLASMDSAGVDRSVAANFAWRDEALVDETNEYLLDAAARSGGRLLPFVSVFLEGGGHGAAVMEEAPIAPRHDARAKLRALASAGARGIGELRPEQSGYNLANSDEADILAWAASAFDLPLLIHASEPVGHAYPGKEGGPIGPLCAFARSAPGIAVIAAHWGGGLPFYALMPEVADALDNVYVDTSAGHLIYDDRIYRAVITLLGAEKILWASDFPLMTQTRSLDRLRLIDLSDEERILICGENAGQLFGL